MEVESRQSVELRATNAAEICGIKTQIFEVARSICYPQEIVPLLKTVSSTVDDHIGWVGGRCVVQNQANGCKKVGGGEGKKQSRKVN